MASKTEIVGDLFPKADEAQWRALAEKALKGRPFDEVLRFTSRDGFAVNALESRAPETPGLPGKEATGGCQILANVDHPDPVEANRLLLEDLEGGAQGLLVRVNPASWSPVIPFDPMAGVMLRGKADMEALLEGVFLDMIRLEFDAGPAGGALKPLVEAVAQARGHNPAALDVAYGADPFSVRAAYGPASPFDVTGGVDRALDEGLDFLLSSRVWHDAGASEGQEISLLLSAGIALLRRMEDAGLDLQKAAQRIAFSMPADADMFFTMAKFRALRQLWAGVLADVGLPHMAFSARAETSTRMLAKRDPWVNILRSTAAAQGAVMAGADRVAVLPFTSALGVADGDDRRLARNVMHILADESFMAAVCDPAAGSFSIETLTEKLAEDAWKSVQNIEAEGGLPALIEGGYLVRVVDEAWEARAASIARGEESLVGVNAFANLAEVRPETLNVAPPASASERLDVGDPLEEGPQPLPVHRLSQAFEDLRDVSDRYMLTHGHRPRVFAVKLGAVRDHAARAAFLANTLYSGGIEMAEAQDEGNDEALVNAFLESEAKTAVLVGTDEAYTDRGSLIEALKAAGAKSVGVVARPEEAILALPVDELIHEGMDRVAFLSRVMMLTGALT